MRVRACVCVCVRVHAHAHTVHWLIAAMSSLVSVLHQLRDPAGRAIQVGMVPSKLVGCVALNRWEFSGRNCTEQHHVLCEQSKQLELLLHSVFFCFH